MLHDRAERGHGARDDDRALGNPARGAWREGRQPADHRRRLASGQRGDPGIEPRGGAACRADVAPLWPGPSPRRGLAAQERGADGRSAAGEEEGAGHPGQSGDVGGAPGRLRSPHLRRRRAGAAGGHAADGHPGAGGGGRLPLRHRRRARRRLRAGCPPPRRVGGRHGLARAGSRPCGDRRSASGRGAGRRPGRARPPVPGLRPAPAADGPWRRRGGDRGYQQADQAGEISRQRPPDEQARAGAGVAVREISRGTPTPRAVRRRSRGRPPA